MGSYFVSLTRIVHYALRLIERKAEQTRITYTKDLITIFNTTLKSILE